jgi:hypothetical protein
MMARCIALDTDCAAICQLAAEAMARASEYATAFCRLCADICQACGDECGYPCLQVRPHRGARRVCITRADGRLNRAVRC